MPRKKVEYAWAITLDGELRSIHRSESGAVAWANNYLTTAQRKPMERATGILWIDQDTDAENPSVMVQRHELHA